MTVEAVVHYYDETRLTVEIDANAFSEYEMGTHIGIGRTLTAGNNGIIRYEQGTDYLRIGSQTLMNGWQKIAETHVSHIVVDGKYMWLPEGGTRRYVRREMIAAIENELS